MAAAPDGAGFVSADAAPVNCMQPQGRWTAEPVPLQVRDLDARIRAVLAGLAADAQGARQRLVHVAHGLLGRGLFDEHAAEVEIVGGLCI